MDFTKIVKSTIFQVRNAPIVGRKICVVFNATDNVHSVRVLTIMFLKIRNNF